MKMSSVRIQLHPSASVAKELNLVIRLSTKGMIHSLSKKQITEAQIGSEYPQIKSVLSKLEKANIVEITGMMKGSLTRPVLKNRWSIEKILEEPLTAAIEGKLSF